MNYSLPERPNLEFLRKQAKDLLKAYRNGDSSVCDVLRGLPWFAFASNEKILAANIPLRDVQFSLARAYGFSHWAELMSCVDELSQEDPAARRARRVQVDGVEDASFDIHWDMPIRALHALLRFRGISASLPEVLAVSGDAFSLCHASHWQGVAYLCTPTNPVQNAVEAYGLEYAATHAGPIGAFRWNKQPEEIAAYTQTILARLRAEIDAGRPILVCGAEAHCGSMSLLVGYEKDRDWFAHVGDGRPYRWVPLRGVADGSVDEDFGVVDGRARGTVTPGFVGGWQTFPAYLIGEPVESPSEQQRWLTSLRRVADLHQAATCSRKNWGGVEYAFGAEAYRRWAEDLERLNYPDELAGPFKTNGVEDAMDWYNMGNMDMQVDQIVTGRSAAEQFCRQAGDGLGGSRGKALHDAADAYQAEVTIARDVLGTFIPRFDGDQDRRAAWFSDAGKRSAGADAIRRMLEHETHAVNQIPAACE